MKIELSHDILAKRIYDKSSVEDKMRIKIHQLLNDHLTLYEENNVLLSKDDLIYINPFLDSIELTPKEYKLVKKSEQFIRRKRYRLYFLVAIVAALLIAFNLITWSANEQNEALLQEEEEHVQLLQTEDSLRTLAEMRADTLYQQLLKTDPQFTKQLIASFDTLRMAKESAEIERNIAQSSTLSNLAETALEQEDKNYAFQLAAKAWELNHDNQLACDLLYRISGSSIYDSNSDIDLNALSPEEHNEYITQLIATERNEKGRGTLDDETMSAIFNQQNTIVQEKEDGIRGKIDRYYHKVQDKAEELYKETGNALRR
ncbi:hypothetical protein [Aureispira anguillae]|uniref:Uncharacterized protein n=1 Tax=Aureispira anguillae TaxID=2864201 RepID=A0A915VK53_9BACT|nr:hypothetical protein [Aureispira anguillae]BDS09522.1 hypothetical protein AsAng_0002230 [Aureispira anguillae]